MYIFTTRAAAQAWALSLATGLQFYIKACGPTYIVVWDYDQEA